MIAKNEVRLEKVPKDLNVADLGTKYVDKATLERLVKILMAYWLQLGMKLTEAKNDKDDEPVTTVALQEVYEKAEQFVLTAELKDWMILMVIVSLVV